MSEHDERPAPSTPPVWGAPAATTPTVIDGTDAVQPEQPSTGSAGKRVSTMAKTLTAVGVAAVIAVGGTIAITSANASTTSSNQAGPGGSGQGGSGGFGGSGRGGGTGRDGAGSAETAVIGSALHGEFVVQDGTATVTERIQTGSVAAVGSSSISVKSTDGYTATYTIGPGVDASSFAAGTDVTVIAKVSGSTVTATSVTAAGTSTIGPGAGAGGSGLQGAAG